MAWKNIGSITLTKSGKKQLVLNADFLKAPKALLEAAYTNAKGDKYFNIFEIDRDNPKESKTPDFVVARVAVRVEE